MKPQVTVAMAAWRPRADWLAQAVDSVLGQRGCDLELVLVDDGSPEPVAGLLGHLSDERLRIVRIDHGGQIAARNAGIEHASAPYIRFADADDVLEPESTARLLGLAEGREDVVAYGSTVVCDADLRPVRTIASSLEGDVTVPCLLGKFDARHVSMLFPRALVARAGAWTDGFEVSADWDFVLRVLEHATARRDAGVASYYRRHGSSAQGSASVAAGEAARRLVIQRFFERHPDLHGSSLERQAYLEADLDRALAYAAAGERRLALSRLARAGRRSPARAVRAAVHVLRPR